VKSRAGRVALFLLALFSGAAGGYAYRASRAGPDPAPVGPAGSEALLRPAGAPLPIASRCEQVAYQGPQTALYSDRPYRTGGMVPALTGYSFCRSHRHGQEVWLFEVVRPTAFLTLASGRHRLEEAGWRRTDVAVRVEAAGLPLDGLYQYSALPGRYAIHYGHARTANPVFWRPADVRLIAPSAARDD
jgi:hypothetical protein